MGEAESGVVRRRKRKEKTETEASEAVPEKKAKTFCSQTFRQELKGNECLKSLKRFISAAKTSDEVIFDYFENGGSLQEILSLLDATAKGDLTTALPVFEILHLILLRFQSSESKHHQKCVESARTILRSHLFIIKALLSMNIAKHKKVALKVLTAIATLDSSFANEIINVAALSPTLIAELIQPSNEKESVRKCFVLFVLSFLVEGNLTVIKNLLDKKGFLNSIIPGLKFDEASTVNLTLSLLEEKILKNVKIPKTLKLKLFNTQIIKSLFDLYEWKGLQGVKQILPKKKNKVKGEEVNQSEKEVVVESVHSFLLLLCCSQKYGVAFHDKSMGTSDQLNNQLLLTVFESIPDPLKNPKMAEVLLKTIASCPDLMKPVLLKVEPSFQPRNSKNWFQAMEFAENLLKAVDATGLLKSGEESLSQSRIVKAGKTLSAPFVFLQAAKLGADKTQDLQVRLRSLRLLTAIWGEVKKLFAGFQQFQEELKKAFHKHVSKFVPDAGELVELWEALCEPEVFGGLPFSQENKVLPLTAVLDSLHVIAECRREKVGTPLVLASNLLSRLEMVKEGLSRQEFDDVQVKIVRFVEIDLQSLTSDMELFEKSVSTLLRSTDVASLPCLSKILSSLEIFERNKAEVDVWLLSLMSVAREHRTPVAEYLIESLRRFNSKQMKQDGFSGEDTLTPDEPLTPLLLNCVRVLKSHSSKSSKKDDKFQTFRHYLNDVIVHLQYFYTVDVYLYDHLKDFQAVLGESTLAHLKEWKSTSLKAPQPQALSCPAELGLVNWLLDPSKKPESVRKVVDVESTNLLKLHSLFRIAVAQLTKRVAGGELSRKDVEKLGAALSLLLGGGAEDEGEAVDLISQDLGNRPAYRRRCLECLFRSQHLLRRFNAFKRKEDVESLTTEVVLRVLMEKEATRSPNLRRRLSEPWKSKFLKKLKEKLKTGRPIDGLGNLERILEFFEYDHSEVVDMVERITSVSDLDLFLKEKAPSAWIGVLSKFVKMHCQKDELEEGVVEKLCLIMKYLSENGCTDMQEMTNCFVFLIRKHPCHLLRMEDEFLDLILRSTQITPETLSLGKLLLNEPGKAQHFLKFVRENLDDVRRPEIAFSLASHLFVDEDSFLKAINVNGSESFWKFSDIDRTKTPEVFAVLEVIYNKFKENILETMAGRPDEVVVQNLEFTRQLIKLFLDKKKLRKMKNELSKGEFEPELALEAVKKLNESAATEDYLRGLLSFLCRTISKSEVTEEAFWTKHCSIVSEVVDFNKNSPWKSVVGSSEWKEFAKLGLGHCFTHAKHPSLMRILHLLVASFYKEDLKDCPLLFQMLISHSQFLKLMLTASPLKAELVELFHCLLHKCPSQMSPKHFPILLASYSASLSPCDRTLLRILRLYEGSGLGVADYEPFVWGETAVSHYSIGTSPGLTLWQRFNMGNVLDLLDGQRLDLSLREFPIRRGPDTHITSDYDSEVYDPAFLLPLFVNLLSPGSVVFCLSFIYKGGLAYTVRALSSESKHIRLMASVVLTRFYEHLELSQNLKQKLVWMHFINCFRYAIEDLAAHPLPGVATLFFARTTLELSAQPAEMYLPLQNFLLAKPSFSFDGVPEFLPLFHSSETGHWRHREWILEVMRDGTKAGSDVNAIFHSMALKVVLSFFCSHLSSLETRKLILQVLERMLRIDKSIILISEYGLLDWISSVDSASFHPLLPDLLALLSTLARAITTHLQRHRPAHLATPLHLVQVLNLAVKLLPGLKALGSAALFGTYLRTMNECCLACLREGRGEWFRLNEGRLWGVVEAGAVVLGEDYGRFERVPFYLRDSGEECACEDLKRFIFLFSKLAKGFSNK